MVKDDSSRRVPNRTHQNTSGEYQTCGGVCQCGCMYYDSMCLPVAVMHLSKAVEDGDTSTPTPLVPGTVPVLFARLQMYRRGSESMFRSAHWKG